MPRRKEPQALKEQSKAFIEKARELGADTPANADAIMKRLARQRRHEEASRTKVPTKK